MRVYVRSNSVASSSKDSRMGTESEECCIHLRRARSEAFQFQFRGCLVRTWLCSGCGVAMYSHVSGCIDSPR
eukprot:2811842-Amphidinium_carterae.1